MTRSLAEVNATLFEIREMPYGVARSTAAATELERVRSAGPDEARAYALFVLVESYVWGDEVTKAYLPFTELLRWWDEHPEHFDADDVHSLFWSFKWMVGHLMDFPAVPAAQIDRTLDDMRRRYALAGNGTNAVALERFQWSRARGAADTEDAYQAWVATPRDDYSQCEACEPGDRADYLFETGRFTEGIRLLEQVLATSPSCATEPGDMLSFLQLAYLEVGDLGRAAATHRRALVHLDGDIALAGAQGRHLEFLARSHNDELAIRRIVAQQDLLRAAKTPADRLAFLTGAGVATSVLRAAHGDRAVRLREVPATTVAELDEWVRAEALALAAAFDARNGTDSVGRRTRSAWDRADARVPVDLSVLGTSAVDPLPMTADAAPHAPVTVPDSEDAEDAQSPDALLTLAAHRAGQDRTEGARLYLAAARSLEAAGRLDDAGFALAESARLAALEGDSVGASTAFARALSLLWAGGVPPRYVGPVARALARVDQTTGLVAVEKVLDRIAGERGDDQHGGDGHGSDGHGSDGHGSDEHAAREQDAAAREERELRDTRARLLATAGRLDEAAVLAEQVTADFTAAGQPADAAHASWLTGSVHRAAGDPVRAADALRAALVGFTAVHDRTARSAVGDELVAVLQTLGRTDEAAAVVDSLIG
ncbi:hypothetical protein [Oerskovia flava]|uniref:hypothetical protein n=1 Tax=Oerskovia flava TaxID=2986422 RepID=UPI00223ECF28|nr:hypothetical protein [Oerskovia sp. JB1-3-2]